jgi:transcriptional regulator with XRE-family HTH domain
MNITLGDRMRIRRRELGLSQVQLGIESSTNQAVIQKIENGRLVSLRPRNIEQIADALEVTPGWLLFGPTEFEKEATNLLQVLRDSPYLRDFATARGLITEVLGMALPNDTGHTPAPKNQKIENNSQGA